MGEKSSWSFRQVVVAGCIAASLAGAVDGLEVGLAGGLGLGLVGIVALLAVGLLVGLALGLPWIVAVALTARHRLDARAFAVLAGALAVCGARLGLELTVVASLGPTVSGAVAMGGAVAVGLALGRIVVVRQVGEKIVWAATGVLGLVWLLGVREGLPPSRPAGMEHPNVLLVSVASTRMDRYGDGQIDTPAWDRLTLEGASFEMAWSPSPDSAVAAAALLSGRGPWEVTQEGPSLASALGSRGYVTGAFVGTSVLSRGQGLEAGFDIFDDDQGWPKGVEQTVGGRLWRLWSPSDRNQRRADEVVDRALRFTGGRSGRWFTWVHLHDPAAPYEPPVPFDERYYAGDDPRDPGQRTLPKDAPMHADQGTQFQGVTDASYVHARYDGEIAWTDAQIARLIHGIEDQGWGPTTLVVWVGLHGESLREGEVWFGRDGSLSEQVLHVPLAMRLPGRVPVATLVSTPVELSDVAATVLAYAAAGEEGVGTGVSMRPTIEGGGLGRTRARALGATHDVALRELGALYVRRADGMEELTRKPGEDLDALPWSAAREEKLRQAASEVGAEQRSADEGVDHP